MKARLLTFGLMILFCSNLFAQREPNKIGYIDMEYILNSIPDYKEANSQLDKKIQQWKGEIDLEQQKIQSLKEDLENERPLLTQDLIDERLDEISYYQKKLQDYQQQRFGPDGDMVAQRRQIMQPIQDEVFNAVQEIGSKREYDFIFDSSADALMLFAASRHDISDQILSSIQRNSRKFSTDRNKAEEDGDDYKSVKQARIDKEKEEEREAQKQQKIDERKTMMEQRQMQRDSLRAARQAEFEARRNAVQQQREERLQKNRQGTNTQAEKDVEVETKTQSEEKENQETTDQTPVNETKEKEEETPRKGNSTSNEKDTSSEDALKKQQEELQKEKENLQAEREAQKIEREQERARILAERQAQRDSVQAERQKMLEKRQKERDSINEARKLNRERR